MNHNVKCKSGLNFRASEILFARKIIGVQRQGFSLIGKKMSKIQCSEHRIKGKISVYRDVMSKGML